MEKTGLMSNIIYQQAINFQTYQLLQQSPDAANHNRGLQQLFHLLKDVKESRNIILALEVENTLLAEEIQLYANSPEEVNSIQKGLVQLQEAKKSLVVVQDSKAYQAATETYSGKNKEAGLPLDSFRQFLKSHAARLSNRMTSNLSVPEKNILRQRKDNLGMVRDIYIAMQREALGLPAPDRSKGLSR